MTAKEIDRGNILASVRDRHIGSIFVHADKRDNLVERSLGIELNLTVLVGNAQSLDGSLPDVYFIPLQIDGFSIRRHTAS